MGVGLQPQVGALFAFECLFGPEYSNVRFWHLADINGALEKVRYWG